MIINKDINLSDFEWWGNAVKTYSYLEPQDVNIIEDFLEACWPDGIDECSLNDLFAFDADFIATILGYADFDSLIEERKYED